ncbi:MAG: prefoldin subunit alpha [archaeon]
MKKRKEKQKPEQRAQASPEGPQELAIRYSFFKEQGEIALNELQRLASVRNDFLASKETIEGIRTAQKGDKVLLPIGGNAYVRAIVDSNDEVLLGVGAGTVLNKPVDDAIKVMDKELEVLRKRENELVSNIKFSEEQIKEILPKLEKYRPQQR